MYTGELISLGVAFSFTATALFAEVASKRMGTIPLNVVRMVISLVLLGLVLWLTMGTPMPVFADGKTWFWLCLSGFVGYVFGDICLFQSYVIMNSRFGQLFMTLASPTAAIAGWMILGERMRPIAILGMIITLFGIGMSVLSKGGGHKLTLKMPLKGVLCGIGAGVGQGVGLVLSKVGMQHYENAIAAQGITDMSQYVSPEAIVPVPLSFMMPFASTMIRAIIGLIGFTILLFVFTKGGAEKLKRGVSDKKTMGCALGAATFGPFFGVSLMLMATLFTSAGIAQTISATTPILIILPSYLLFHQKVTVLEVVGAFISVLGVTLFFL
jgi:drug/metabolite transporter (DMT)-like permease